MNLIPKNSPIEFNKFFFGEIDLKLYKYKFLRDFVEKVARRQVTFYDSSVINKNNKGWILIIHSEILLIYGENWNVNQFQELSKVFDLNKFNNFTLSGENDLIDALISFFNIKNIEENKRRLFYQTEKVHLFENKNLKIELGALKDINELAEMLQEYYHEEYGGQNDKEIEEMEDRIFSLIQTDSLFVLLNENNEILSFCSINGPDIGIMFTKAKHRSNGYGKVILSYCSNILIQRNNKAFVMTDRDNIQSNKVCTDVGFSPYYKHKMITINFG